MKIAVIGSGSWGTAVSILLSKNSHDVFLWSWQEEESMRLQKDRENKEFLPGVPFPDNIFCSHDIKECVNGAKIVVYASISPAVRGIAKQIALCIDKNAVVVNISKGLEEGTLLRLSEVLKEEIPKNPIAVMSGPSHAEEVSKGLPTTNVLAASDISIANEIRDVFMNEYFRVYTSTDIAGVELGGALKNVVALCAGICDGLGFGDNTKAALMTRGIAEITRLGVKMGAKEETFHGLSGIGDLIVTCTSKHSRNRSAGFLLGQGHSLCETLEKVHMVVEGVNTAKAAYDLSLKYDVDMPITKEANLILFEGKDPRKAVFDLMTRDAKKESED